MQGSNHTNNKSTSDFDEKKNSRSEIDWLRVTHFEKQKIYDEFNENLTIFKPPDETAKLPEDWIYANIDEAARNCRKVYFFYLALISYALLTIFTTQDHHFIIGQKVIELPVIKATVPLKNFLFFIPLLAVGMFIYIQIYMLKIYNLIDYAFDQCLKKSNCKPEDCDIHICIKQQNRIYPWIILFSRYSTEKIVSVLQRIFTRFSIWWLLPITLLLFSLIIIKKHDPESTYIMLSIALLGTAIVLAFWVKNKDLEMKLSAETSSISKEIISSLKSFFRTLSNLLKRAIRSDLSSMKQELSVLREDLEMKLSAETSSISKEIITLYHFLKRAIKSDLDNMKRELRVFGEGLALLIIIIIMAVFIFSLSIRANEGKLAVKLDHWSGKVSYLTKIWRNFAFVDFSYQELDKLDTQDLQNARLEGANFTSTILTKANLINSSLKNAKLLKATLDNAELEGAKLHSADLRDASLKGAVLHQTQLQGSDLTQAKLQRANLSYANLQNANLSAANLRGAKLNRANLQYADLRSTEGITIDQLKLAGNYLLAFYSPEFIKKLGLEKDHNKKVTESILIGYNFSSAKLQGADLLGANLQNSDLSGAILKKANLQRADLREADMQKANLEGANLRGARLHQTKLEMANLQGADLRETKWSGDHIAGAKFKNKYSHLFSTKNYKLASYSKNLLKTLKLPPDHNYRLKKRNLGGYELQGANLQEADLRETHLKDANLQNTDLKGAHLNKADLRQANLKGANLQGTDLREAEGITNEQLLEAKNYKLAYYSMDVLEILQLPLDHNDRVKEKNFKGYGFNNHNLQNADLWQANLSEAELQKADLGGADLSEADLRKANLNKAKLQKTDLSRANLKKAKLQGTTLLFAILAEADLSEADFTGANLKRANLQNSDLKGAYLVKANLRDTNLKDANLQGTDLGEAEGITKEQLLKAKNYKLAYYSKDMLEILKLPQDHNARVKEKDLVRYDFQGASLREAVLQKANLAGAKLQGADLTKTDLLGADLSGTCLKDTDLKWANLCSIRGITKYQLSSARNYKLALYSNGWVNILKLPPDHNRRVKKKKLNDYDLQKANFMNADLSKANFKDADLRGADLREADMQEANLEGADLRGAKLHGAELREANLQRANLRETQGIEKKQLEKAANWQLAYYSDVAIKILGLPNKHNKTVNEKNLNKYDFQVAILKGADLQRAILVKANLQGANLTEADLLGANLKEANLQGAILKRANLKEVKLKRANLKEADLRGADISEAKLIGANLQEADLRDIMYTDRKQFSMVKTLYQARLNETLMLQLTNRYPFLFKKPVE